MRHCKCTVMLYFKEHGAFNRESSRPFPQKLNLGAATISRGDALENSVKSNVKYGRPLKPITKFTSYQLIVSRFRV